MPRTRTDKTTDPLEVLLRGYLTAQGASLNDAAAVIGIHPRTLCNRLMNVKSFTIGELLNIARKYNIPIEDVRAAIRK